MTGAETRPPGTHDHVYLGRNHDRNAGRTRLVIIITAAMMVGEIAAGSAFGSMALVADGWHMFTHASALMIALVAYRFARTNATNPRFTFGTGKVADLAAFASAVVLGIVALLIAWESLERLRAPVTIGYGQAILVAVLGLAVNLACAWLLREDHGHDHGPQPHAAKHHDHHDHDHDHDHSSHEPHATDNNLRAAYLHVLADALTSVLAILALVIGRSYGLPWLDPVIGIVGALLIARWSVGLMRDTGAVLVDALPDARLPDAIRRAVEVGGTRITDLHVWHLGPGHHGAIFSVVCDGAETADTCRARLTHIAGLSHVTVEVQTA